MPMDVLEVTKKFMRDPIRILVKKEELTLEGIKQFYINVEREVRGHHLKTLYDCAFLFKHCAKTAETGLCLGFCSNASRVHTGRRKNAQDR